jgi:hypothetical protein
MLILPYLESVDELAPGLHPDLPRLTEYLTAMGYENSLKGYDVSQIQQLSAVEQEHFLGQYKSPADFAKESLSNAYGSEIDALPSMISNAIDWAQVWDKDYRHDCLAVEIDDLENYHWLIWHAH